MKICHFIHQTIHTPSSGAQRLLVSLHPITTATDTNQKTKRREEGDKTYGMRSNSA